MSQRDDSHQQDRRVNELIHNLERAPSILRNLLQETQSLRNQLEVVAEQLRATEEKLAISDEARLKAEDLGRDWERRARSVEQRSSRDDGVRDVLRKFGEARVLYYLDVLATRESVAGEPSSQEESIDGPSLRTLAFAIEKWVNGISRSKLSRVFEDVEVIVDRDQIIGLVEFQPSNPFSDEFPRARCRVLESGWRSGDFIIEKALLEPIESISDYVSHDQSSIGEQSGAVFDEMEVAKGKMDQIQKSGDDNSSNSNDEYLAEVNPPELQIDLDEQFTPSDKQEYAARQNLESSDFWKNLGKKQKVMNVIFAASLRRDPLADVINGFPISKQPTLVQVKDALKDWQVQHEGETASRYERFLGTATDPDVRAFFERRWQQLLDE